MDDTEDGGGIGPVEGNVVDVGVVGCLVLFGIVGTEDDLGVLPPIPVLVVVVGIGGGVWETLLVDVV